MGTLNKQLRSKNGKLVKKKNKSVEGTHLLDKMSLVRDEENGNPISENNIQIVEEPVIFDKVIV